MADAHHIVQPRTYYLIFAALIVLTVTTVGIDILERQGSFEMPPLAHSWVSMGIAVAKASLVILFFMHLWYSPWLTWIVAGGSLLWLGILITYTVTDYASRAPHPTPGAYKAHLGWVEPTEGAKVGLK